MDCACITVDCGAFPAARFKNQNRTARKAHRCCECHKIINPGEQYRYDSGIWDGEPQSFKTCLDCVSIQSVYFCEWTFGEIWNDLRENMNEDGLASIESFMDYRLEDLTPGARAAVMNLIEHERLDWLNEHPMRLPERAQAKFEKYRWKYHSEPRAWLNPRKAEMDKVEDACFDAADAAIKTQKRRAA